MRKKSRIDLKKVHPSVKSSYVHMAENLGYNTANKFGIDIIKEICDKYEQTAETIEKRMPDCIPGQDVEIIVIQNIPKGLNDRLRLISERIGFKSISELLRFEMHMKFSTLPSHMLKKNKGFKEIEQ